MKVKCIESSFSFIKYGEVYDVVAEHKNEYTIKTPSGNKIYNKANFEVVKSIEQQLKEAQEKFETLEQESKQALAAWQNLIKEYEKRKIPKRGQIYIDISVMQEYIVAQVTNGEYCLINLEDGNRYSNATDKIENIFGRHKENFILKNDHKNH